MIDNPLDNRGHVLIVEDSPNDLQYIVTVLRQKGYVMHAATNAQVALAFVKNSLPDLILLDMHLPEVDGFQLCALLKADERTRDVPVIFVSAENRSIDRVRAFSVGAVDYITKPFQEEEALARIGTHISLRRLTERLTEEKERAEEANRAKSQFLANMSHELRTPLNAILGFSQILKMTGGLEARQLRGVDCIHDSGEHLLRLINDILDLARIEAGKMPLVPVATSLSTMMRFVSNLIAVRAEPKGLRFACESSADLPPAVLVDEKRLSQVLINLLGNSVKFTQHGAITLRLCALPETGDFARLRFEVEDTGSGIDAHCLHTIFQPFEQVGDERQRVGGAGLGLAISRRIVQSMGSDIHVDSELGRGSRFWFELLLPLAEKRVAARPQSNYQRVTSYDGPRKTVLVVDDIQANREIVVGALGLVGLRTIEASDGHEALMLLRTYEPDLVILDVNMPRLNGLEASRMIRQTPRFVSLPIIAMSSSSYDSDRQNALDAGADAFLPKPLDFDKLLDRLGHLLQIRWVYRSPLGATREAEMLERLVPGRFEDVGSKPTPLQ